MINFTKTKKGFTLTELLIALAVLAIIAAVTVPSMITITNKHNYVNGLKRSHLMLKTAISAIMADNGGTMVKVGNAADSAALRNAFADRVCSKLNCIKICYANSLPGVCFHNTAKTLQGTDYTFNMNWEPRAILSNGMLLIIDYGTSACNLWSATNGTSTACGSIWRDINGFKPPNQLGRDIFNFGLLQTGIIPNGTKSGATTANWNIACNPSSASGSNGIYCAGKVLTEGAMNY